MTNQRRPARQRLFRSTRLRFWSIAQLNTILAKYFFMVGLITRNSQDFSTKGLLT